MLEKNVENDRLRMVAEYVADFERQLYENQLAEKDREIEAINSQKDKEIEAINSQKDKEIEAINSQKDAEIAALKAKLEENGIAY